MVVEHPALLFEEIARVLRPGGRLLLHTPNATRNTTRLTRLLPGRLLAPVAGVLAIRVFRSPRWQHFRACLLIVAEPRPHA
jgi:hypothetical protein